MTTADARLRRLLDAFPLMADEPSLSLDALAARVGTDARTLRKDFASLERYELPGGFIESIRVEIGAQGVEMHSPHFKRPQRLTRPELLALDLGLSMLLQELPIDERAAVRDARRRLAQLVVPRVATAAGTASDPAVAVETARAHELGALAALQRALEQGLVVRLAYQRPDETVRRTRMVHPYALVRADANVYLVGWCEQAGALRVFRLDRVHAVDATNVRFTVPESFSLEQVLRSGHVFQQEEPGGQQLTVFYRATVARWVAEREQVPLDADGTVTVRYPLADEHWAIRHVLQYGPDAVIVEPASLRARVDALLAEMLTAAG
jgi:proteasome accessory factor C